MSRRENLSASAIVHITISVQSERVLQEIAKQGIYGRSTAEVAARLVDQALEKFTGVPHVKIRPVAKTRR